jgi:hypothetical protein
MFVELTLDIWKYDNCLTCCEPPLRVVMVSPTLASATALMLALK